MTPHRTGNEFDSGDMAIDFDTLNGSLHNGDLPEEEAEQLGNFT